MPSDPPNRMTPSALHVPPLAGASHKSIGAPPAKSSRFSFPSAKNAMDRLSGDQKGSAAPSVPGSAVAVKEFKGRNHSSDLISSGSAARYTSKRPSGEIALIVLLTAILPGGTSIVKRTGCTSGAGWRIHNHANTAAAASDKAATAGHIHLRRGASLLVCSGEAIPIDRRSSTTSRSDW